MVSRIISSILVGIVVYIVTLILIWVLSTFLPFGALDSTRWATVIGVLVALLHFFSGRNWWGQAGSGW